jgi:hypothetical protein
MPTWTELTIRVLTAIGATLALVKVFHGLRLARRKHLRVEYRFARKFLKDISSMPPATDLLVEKGFAALYGPHYLTADQIRFLIAQRPASLFIDGFRRTRGKVLFDPVRRELRFDGLFRYPSVRRLAMAFYATIYLITVVAALSPFVFWEYTAAISRKPMLLALFALGAFGSFAASALTEGFRIRIAVKLVREQTRVLSKPESTTNSPSAQTTAHAQPTAAGPHVTAA